MTDEQREAVIDFVRFLMRFVERHGNHSEQAEVLAHWSAIYESFVVDRR